MVKLFWSHVSVPIGKLATSVRLIDQCSDIHCSSLSGTKFDIAYIIEIREDELHGLQISLLMNWYDRRLFEPFARRFLSLNVWIDVRNIRRKWRIQCWISLLRMLCSRKLMDASSYCIAFKQCLQWEDMISVSHLEDLRCKVNYQAPFEGAFILISFTWRRWFFRALYTQPSESEKLEVSWASIIGRFLITNLNFFWDTDVQ